MNFIIGTNRHIFDQTYFDFSDEVADNFSSWIIDSRKMIESILETIHNISDYIVTRKKKKNVIFYMTDI